MNHKIAVVELKGYTEISLTDEQYLSLHMFFQHFAPDVEEIYVTEGVVGVTSEWEDTRKMILEDYPDVEYVDVYTLDKVDMLTPRLFWFKVK